MIAERLETALAAAEAARTGGGGSRGRGGEGSGPSPSVRPRNGSKTTRPSLPPDPTRNPGGTPEPVKPRSSSETQTGISGENHAAVILARSGYDLVQQPPPKSNDKKPDYFMEGDYWDCYTPITSNIERVRKSIKDKVSPKDGRPQADRIVLNLDFEHKGERTTLTLGEIEGIMQRKPLADLKELKVIADGRVHDIDLGG